MQFQLNISGHHYNAVKEHLFPGDGLEAVAVALCGRYSSNNLHKLMVHDIVLIPHDECQRSADLISWPTERLLPLLQKVSSSNFAILKIHSHPGGYNQFSSVDDKSDEALFSSVFGWTDSDAPHASAVMLPNGEVFGRIFNPDLSSSKLSKVIVAGDVIKIWNFEKQKSSSTEVNKRSIQAFGEGTFSLLENMKVGIIGCSGTGSPVIEQLTRLGVGKLVLVDPDKIELKNLNRILNSKRKHAEAKEYKVKVLKEAISEFDLGTEVVEYAVNLYDDVRMLRDLSSCDVLVGCVDSVDGRDLINLLSTYYIIPYFDLGIKLEADGNGGISKIVGTVHYLQPGLSSLKSRGMYDLDDLKAAGLLRKYPEQFPDFVKNSYIKNISVDRPAVISVNIMIASYAVNEMLNRLHPYKNDDIGNFARTTIDITEGCFIHTDEGQLSKDSYLATKIGLGDRKLFLDSIDILS